MMAKAAKILEKKGASIIDINMGCPVKKVVSGGDGSALMRTPQLASDIVKSIKDAVSIPVTVKFRLGYTAMEQNFLEFAKLMEQSGADAMTIHCRTRSQMYSGKADWSAIADVKKEVKVPVFANGDILSPEDAKNCIQKSNTDGVAVGRGVLGAPDLIYRIEHYLNFGEILSAPSHVEKIQLLKEHINTEIVLRGEHVAIQFVRKFYPYYIKGIRDAAVYRGAIHEHVHTGAADALQARKHCSDRRGLRQRRNSPDNIRHIQRSRLPLEPHPQFRGAGGRNEGSLCSRRNQFGGA